MKILGVWINHFHIEPLQFFLLHTLPPKVTLVLFNAINIGRADTIP